MKTHFPASKTFVSSPVVDFQKRHSTTFATPRSSTIEDVLMEEAIITMESPSAVAEALQICPIQHVEFNCCVCNEKVSQNLKPAYEKGVVIVSCPGCQNLHLLGDNLGLNGYSGNSIEDIVNGSLLPSKWENVGCTHDAKK